MPFTLTMPKLSPTMEEGTIVKWHRSIGDFIEANDLLFEVATDKATVEYNALDEGWLRGIIVDEDGTALVNQAVAIFSEDKDESIEGYIPEGLALEEHVETEEALVSVAASQEEHHAEAGKAGMMFQPAFTPPPPLDDYTFEYPVGTFGDRLKVSPLARRTAKDQGLDLSTIKGSGPHGRIMNRDLEGAQAGNGIAFGSQQAPTRRPGEYEEQQMTPMRKMIAKRLQESKTFIPHWFVSQTIDAEPMESLREQLKTWGLKVTYNDFIVRATALALRKHPAVNSGFNTVNNTIVLYKTIDICIAVSMDGGLITPIVRHADYKNLGQLSTEVRNLAKKARKGKLEPSEYQGGSFTISNLGMYGITDFQAIINPPQGAILAVGGVESRPVVKKGVVVPGKTMSLSLSSDHRIIDGAVGAEFMQTLKVFLENPAGLLV